jgi:hypothetical protein
MGIETPISFPHVSVPDRETPARCERCRGVLIRDLDGPACLNCGHTPRPAGWVPLDIPEDTKYGRPRSRGAWL